ncbi:MAG: Uma2 family endonuclease [Planctomycetes bacterium]|nr:Uma2 family endonuclease [Planctomycetota bacterium]
MSHLMTTSPRVPVLRAGDTLTRDEFERRYAAMPDQKKAELIAGVVYMPSPVRFTQHGLPHRLLAAWLTDYVRGTPGTQCCIDASVRLAPRDEPQPDLALFLLPPHGAVRVGADGFLVGPPELAVEVAASSVSYDLHQKLAAYEAAGVREYHVLRAEDAEVDWFVLRGGAYARLAPDGEGVLRSEAFPGLWLDVPALLRNEDPGLAAAARAGLQSPGHAAFRARLGG